MRSFIFALLALCVSWSSAMAASCSAANTKVLLDKLFSSLGPDCEGYASLFTDDAKYFHQHDGFKKGSELLKNCQGYAEFCPGKAGKNCNFVQNGEALTVTRENECHILVPYLWSELPANNRAKGNLEPHTGWEYIVASPDRKSTVGFNMKYFAEIETSYSVAFNWAKPDDTPAVVAESALHLLSLGNSASKRECNNPIAPVLTKFFNEKSGRGNVWRQQGDAVVLAAGDLCQVAVTYAAQVGAKLGTGHFIFMLKPTKNSYRILDTVEFLGAKR